ncbi:hypothetical protein HPB50_008491 [Hyalomma asiaticum]|uniref:Uncharacterized protein n=1 Tax=Hyalomma asiaticum TaxID=266040 RepID=A0ACB7SCH2_HYAAI|nr:hypothetical protein HPB50_008491 [Hyalomma asiaticum]
MRFFGASERLVREAVKHKSDCGVLSVPPLKKDAAQGVHDAARISEQQQDDFVATPDGRFHLSNGIYVSANQAEKLFKNKKPSIVVRDAAQVVCRDDLAKRSVSGRLAPTRSGTNEQRAKQLTPSKWNVVYDCLRHWGRVKVSTPGLPSSLFQGP